MNALGGRRGAFVAVLLCVAAAFVALLAFLGPRWSRGDGGTWAPPRPLTSARIEPQSALFGDVLTARVLLVADRAAIDPNSVRISTRFAPYRIVDRTRTVGQRIGRAEQVEYVFRLRCLTPACVDLLDRRDSEGRPQNSVSFKAAELVGESPAGEPWSAEVRWPDVVVRSRLSVRALEAGEPQAGAYEAADVGYRISPDVLGWALLLVAGGLAAGGGWLVAVAVRGTTVGATLRIPGNLSPIDRALALARYAAQQGDAVGERRALERLASELRNDGREDLASTARRLAWSERDPDGEALDELAAEVSGVAGGRV